MLQPIYRPLCKQKREIRILVLRPARHHYSRLKCDLIQVDLDALEDAPFDYYEAVSYTWGDPTGTKPIELNGHDFRVTKNLHALLKRLRAKRSRGYYWVDALCIDQQNIPERGQQVQLMKAIYEHAEQVLVWLGPASDDSDLAMDLMDEITDADEDDPSDSEALIEKLVLHLQASLTDPKDKRKWEALAKLFHRPWWKRVWIRQEVAVASHIMVLCGNNGVQHWPTLVSAVEFLDRVAGFFQPFVRSLGGLSSGYVDAIHMDTFREQIREEGFVNEEVLFLHSRQCEATDFRDRIFGMVGLADEETRKALVPNYEMSGRDVFIMATKYLMTRRDTLDCLSGCRGHTGGLDLPSWAIDFTADWSENPFRSREDQQDLYHASGTISPHISFQEGLSVEALCVKGLVINTITDISSSYLEEVDDRYHELETTTSTVELLGTWFKVSGLSSGGRDVQKMMEPWFRTMVADQDDIGQRASADFINESFPIEEQQHSVGNINFDLVNETCQRYCDSAPITHSHSLNRRLFVTASGLLGLGPRLLAKSDVVCIIYGCGVPIVLRPAGDDKFLIVGEAYVHSIMDGEAMENRHQYAEHMFTIL